MVDLNDIAIFVQVVRFGSFAEVARQQGVPPNTISRRVQQLELQVGTRLLQRSTRKLTVTSAGQTFHDQCVAAVDGLLNASQELLIGSTEPSGLVRVAAPADFFDFFQLAWVVAFLSANPRVRLDFVLSDSVADLIADRIDVAVRGGPMQDSMYIGRQLIGPRSDGLVASPLYVSRRGAPLTLKDLTEHDCVTSAHPSGFTTWRLSNAHGIEEDVHVTGRFHANTAQALRKATLAGLGIALLPPTMTYPDLKAGRLVRILPQYQRSWYALNVLYPSRRHLPKAVAAFIDLLMEKLGVPDIESPPGRFRQWISVRPKTLQKNSTVKD